MTADSAIEAALSSLVLASCSVDPVPAEAVIPADAAPLCASAEKNAKANINQYLSCHSVSLDSSGLQLGEHEEKVPVLEKSILNLSAPISGELYI